MYDIDALRVQQNARQFLKERLPQNQIALFVGAGVSMAVGLPSWGALARRIALKAGIARANIRQSLSVGEFVELMDEAEASYEDGRGFRLSVRDSLYHRHHPDLLELCQTPILLSLGSLLSGGRRGRITDVISLNFDDVLESYLALHGFLVQSIGRLPELVNAEATQIIHVHGFLPRSEESGGVMSDFLILSRRAAEKRMSDRDNLYRGRIQDVLSSKICLFVGMSEKTATDYILSPLLLAVAQRVSRRPIGFWFFRGKEDAKIVEHLKERGVAAIYVEEYNQIASFLLSVCEEAGRDIRVAGA